MRMQVPGDVPSSTGIAMPTAAADGNAGQHPVVVNGQMWDKAQKDREEALPPLQQQQPQQQQEWQQEQEWPQGQQWQQEQQQEAPALPTSSSADWDAFAPLAQEQPGVASAPVAQGSAHQPASASSKGGDPAGSHAMAATAWEEEGDGFADFAAAATIAGDGFAGFAAAAPPAALAEVTDGGWQQPPLGADPFAASDAIPVVLVPVDWPPPPETAAPACTMHLAASATGAGSTAEQLASSDEEFGEFTDALGTDGQGPMAAAAAEATAEAAAGAAAAQPQEGRRLTLPDLSFMLGPDIL